MKFMSAITIKTLKEFFEALPSIQTNLKAYNEWKAIWETILKNHDTEYTIMSPDESPIVQVFPLIVKDFFGYDIEIHFLIDRVIYGVKTNQFNTSTFPLSKMENHIWYTHLNSKRLSDNFNKTPIIGVYCPTYENNSIKEYSIIDGNHRVSAAFYLSKEVEITTIIDPFIPTFYYANLSSCYAFHIIQGYVELQSRNNDNKFWEVYLQNLSTFPFKYCR